MVIVVQRSVTFPPIKLKRIDEYIKFVATRQPTPSELREVGIEIGRGRGDITRFLERLGVVEQAQGRVALTPLGRHLASLREALGVAVYHALFFQRLPQYRVMVEAVAEGREGDLETLFKTVNTKLSAISPSVWINKVAFKTLIQIGEDVGVLEKQGSLYRYLGDPVERALVEYHEKSGVKIGYYYYVPADKLIVPNCGKPEPPNSLYRVEILCVLESIYKAFQM